MTVERKHNHKAASEDEVGHLHGVITKIRTIQLNAMLAQIEKLEGTDIDINALVDERVMNSTKKWVADMNQITFAAPEATVGNKLKDSLDAIKEKQKLKLVANGGTVSYEDDEE